MEPHTEANRKLRTMQQAHEGVMLNITWNDEKTAMSIRKQNGVRDIIEDLNNSKWTWARHIVRMEDNRWTTMLTNWTPRTNNPMRGRMKTRWRDDIYGFQTQWKEATGDRRLWRQLRSHGI